MVIIDFFPWDKGRKEFSFAYSIVYKDGEGWTGPEDGGEFRVTLEGLTSSGRDAGEAAKMFVGRGHTYTAMSIRGEGDPTPDPGEPFPSYAGRLGR